MKKTIWFLFVLLSACSSVPMITDLDVSAHEQNGDLPDFYRQLQADLALAKPGSEVAENRQRYVDVIGEKIAQGKEQQILDGLDREFEKHSISTLQAAMEQAADIQPYSQKVYADLRMQFEQAMNQKRGVILGKEAEYYELSDKDAVQKVALLDAIAKIHGTGADADQVRLQRSAYIESLFKGAQEGIKNRRYKKVAMLLENLEKIDPDYIGLSEIRYQLLAADYEQQLWDALEKGQTDIAYSTFYKISKLQDYVQTHADLVPIAEDMVRFFIAEGDQAPSIDTAYQSYSRARYIKTVIGQSDLYSPGEKNFIEQVNKRLLASLDQSLYVPAYGLLMVIAELMPEHPALLKHADTVHAAVLADASIKLIMKELSAADRFSALAHDVLAEINRQLMAAMPVGVQLIGGSVAASHYLPTQIVLMENPASYYVLDGEVLDARVKTDEVSLTSTERVLIAYVTEANPDYQAWEDLGKRKQKDVPQPPATLEKPVWEDVAISKSEISQKGSLSVAYRMADAVSASVVLSDTVTHKEEFTAERIPAVRAGLFVQEEKVAELHTDEEIQALLSVRLAAEIAGKLAAGIDTLQKAYVSKAEQSVVWEEFNIATTYYAYSYALSQAKQHPDEDVLSKLRTYALRWN